MNSNENPEMAERIRASFARQGMMETLGADILEIGKGRVVIAAPIDRRVSQQQGAGHAGLAFSLGDSAAGYAALTMMPLDAEVVTTEMKIHLLAPALGQRLVAEGRVIRSGRRLIVAAAEVYAEADDTRSHVATLLGTMMPVSR